jgi:hypothetical protein
VAQLGGGPFTVRELVILSPYARERSDDSRVPDAHLTPRFGATVSGSAFEDRTRIRWSTIREFTGIEVPAVILTDADLPKQYHRDLLYVGVSRATDRLVVFEAEKAI